MGEDMVLIKVRCAKTEYDDIVDTIIRTVEEIVVAGADETKVWGTTTDGDTVYIKRYIYRTPDEIEHRICIITERNGKVISDRMYIVPPEIWNAIDDMLTEIYNAVVKRAVERIQKLRVKIYEE